MNDPVSAIETILEGNWNSGNTANRTPLVNAIEEQKKINLRDKDAILLYASSVISTELGGAGTDLDISELVHLDIRTVYSRAQLFLIMAEVLRILGLKAKYPDSDYYRIDLNTARGIELSNKSTGLWRFVLDVNLKEVLS